MRNELSQLFCLSWTASLLLAIFVSGRSVDAFVAPTTAWGTRQQQGRSTERFAAGDGFAVKEQPPPPPTTTTTTTSVQQEDTVDLSKLSVLEIKQQLLDLLPKMTGEDPEFRQVEEYVNALENSYAPPQTLDFLNLAMGGVWQLLFSTTLKSGPTSKFRLRELVQRVDTNHLGGKVENAALWDLSEGDDGVFESSGTFAVQCNYTINQGARMVMSLEDHVLALAPAAKAPEDFQAVVGMIYRQMPSELFDPDEHALDTTYLDGDLRIVRVTGPRYEGTRDIFIRSGSMEIDPTKA